MPMRLLLRPRIFSYKFPIFLSLLYATSCSLQELYTLRFRQNLYYSFKSSLKPLRALILYCVYTTTLKMANELKSATLTIIALVREQITIIQQSFTDALAQQRAILEAQHQQLIKAIYKELYDAKVLALETLTVTPINKIKITVCEPGPLNANPKLVTVT